ncbi:unnamed protein product [Cyclocybe aegerita]|uniref:MYND-type domain-containing protein n=1 Tax=Cyclocybe aegerita TaxID=1973307 RepID=A0A8S0WV22_CYCAE|nr:unnamed protein product [Cyclocybe aegerita]
MAYPVLWPRKLFFYPIGNTSPVCFTQELAPEVDADILLLACGDPRSILYTIHADLGTESRKLDFTCCDWEPAILARNILLLTMIVDGVEAGHTWPIFYHFFLNQASYDVLLAQCRTLVQSSTDMAAWKASKYGKWLHFCDDSSLAHVRRQWTLYLETDAQPRKEKQILKASFTAGMKSVLKTHAIVSTAGPAAGPLIHTYFENNCPNKIKSCSEFWSTGVTAPTLFKDSVNQHVNPTFVYSLSGKKFNVHYGTDPIRAFHLAPAFAPLKDGKSLSNVTLATLVELAMAQFSSWCSSFKKRLSSAQPNINVRFAVAESRSFAQALQYCRDIKVTKTGVYVSPWGGAQINFDTTLYGSSPTAPMVFDVIDTSNVTDHAGLLNILVVTIPLLKGQPSSVLYTDTLLPHEDGQTVQSGLLDKACADIPTLALLLGIAPTSHLSHFTTNSNKHHLLAASAGSDISQIHEPIAWKIPCSVVPGIQPASDEFKPSMIAFAEPRKLEELLLSIYLQMFSDENQMENMRNIGNMASYRKQHLLCYLRGTFVLLLRLIKARVDVGWNQIISNFCLLVGRDRTLLMGLHSFQELSCQLHLHGIHTQDVFTSAYLETVRTQADPFRDWNIVPPVVCIVLKVPRRNLKVVEDIDPDAIGAPPLQCESSALSFHNIHPSIQLIFGDILVSSGGDHSEIAIQEDLAGWEGDSPLIVSFYLPSWILTDDPKNTQIGLHFRNIPATMALIPQLGMRLAIFSTMLTDKKHVHVVHHRPNNSGEFARLRHQPVIPILEKSKAAPENIVLGFGPSATKMQTLTLRDKITDPKAMQSLSDGATVTTTPVADCSVLVTFQGYQRVFVFPFPLVTSQCKTRIARKSSYIEIECPIRATLEEFAACSLNPFPVVLHGQTPNLLNVHYLHLDKLPALRLPQPVDKLQWLSVHLAMSMSDRERQHNSATKVEDQDLLVGLRSSICTFFIQFSGLEPLKARPRFFGLHNPETGNGVYTYIFVNDIKLDLSANTLVADACVIPFTRDLVSRLAPILYEIGQDDLPHIPTYDEETKVWKKLLPVFVERCRTWKHRSTCEYLTEGIPASSELPETPLCSCGKGKDLGEFGKIPKWKALHPEATRVAICLLFTFSFMEEAISKVRANLEPSDAANKRASPSSARSISPACANCGGPGKPSLLTCGRCKDAQYCSATCQKAHWKAHKPKCRVAAART